MRSLQTVDSRGQNRDGYKGAKQTEVWKHICVGGIEYVAVCSCINRNGREYMCICASGGQKMTLEPVTVAW